MFAHRFNVMTWLFVALFISFAMSQTALYEGSNRFALELYQKLKGDDSSNLVCSPISLQIVLAMAYAGAAGNSAKVMKGVMHFPESMDSTLEGHKALLDALQDPVLKIASKMYIEQSFKLKEPFKNTVVKYFNSEVENVPFASDQVTSANTINQWVEKKTNDKIKDLIDAKDIDPLTKLILVNAIHFKAKWKTEFNKNLTFDSDFYITKEKTIRVRMMHQSNHFNYGQIDELQASVLELPYAGDKFKMVIILPYEIDGLKEVEQRLATMNLVDILGKLRNTKVEVSLPRFKIEKTLDLGDTLKNMGLNEIFSSNANFSNIADEPLVISKVIQKAFIEVNEEGTEAAAATGLTKVKKSLLAPKPNRFKVNCPSLLFLSISDSMVPVFTGMIAEPDEVLESDGFGFSF